MLKVKVISLIPIQKTVHLNDVNPEDTLDEIIRRVCVEHADICEYYDEQVLLTVHEKQYLYHRDQLKHIKLRDLLNRLELPDDVVKLYIVPVLEGGKSKNKLI